MSTYFVKNGGDDSKDGLSDANAWATISKVNGESFSPGDLVQFNKGDTWIEILVVPSSGTSGNQITFGRYGTGARPILTIANATNDHVIKLNTKDYITFIGLEIDGNKANQSTKGDGINSVAFSSNHIVLTDLYIHDTFHSGAYFNGTDTVSVTNSTLTDNGADGVDFTVFGQGLHFASSKNVTATSNTISGSFSDGIFVAGNALYAGENIILNNNDISGVLTDQRSLITLWSETNSEIYENNLHDTIDKPHGINAIFVRGHSGDHSNADIYSNTIARISGVGIELQDGGNNVYDNTIALIGTGSDAMGIFVAGDDQVIKTNTIGPTTRHGIYITGARDNVIVERNEVFNAQNSSSLIRFVNNSSAMTNIKVQNNDLYDNQDTITTARGIYSTGSESNDGLELYNNTLSNLPLGIEIAISDGMKIKNNVISLAATNTYAIHLWSTNTNVTSDYNCLFPEEASFLRFAPTSYSTLSAWTAGTGLDTNSITGDPLLDSNHKLQSGSPAIGAGVFLGADEGIDFRGGRHNIPPDMGAVARNSLLKGCLIKAALIL